MLRADIALMIKRDILFGREIELKEENRIGSYICTTVKMFVNTFPYNIENPSKNCIFVMLVCTLIVWIESKCPVCVCL